MAVWEEGRQSPCLLQGPPSGWSPRHPASLWETPPNKGPWGRPQARTCLLGDFPCNLGRVGGSSKIVFQEQQMASQGTSPNLQEMGSCQRLSGGGPASWCCLPPKELVSLIEHHKALLLPTRLRFGLRVAGHLCCGSRARRGPFPGRRVGGLGTSRPALTAPRPSQWREMQLPASSQTPADPVMG